MVEVTRVNKAVLVKGEDWEGLYVNDELKDEGHTLNEGKERITYFLQLSEQYNFDLKDMKIVTLNEYDNIEVLETGNLPSNITELLTYKIRKYQ